MEEKQEQTKTTVSNTEIRELENQAVDSFMKGDKPYRKVFRKTFTQVRCRDCGETDRLILITNEKESSFKKPNHKSNRNRIPLLDNSGNKIYLCKECIIKRVKKAREKEA